MKWLCVFLTFLVCAPLTFAQQHKSDRELAGLKGAVKSVLTESENLLSPYRKDTTERLPTSEAQYDELGNLILYIVYSSLRFPLKMTFLTVDGAKASKTARSLSEGAPYDTKYEDKYDARGNLIERLPISSDGTLSLKIVSRYDDHGNKVREERYKPDGSTIFSRSSIFDEKGNEVGATNYIGAGIVTASWEYEYLAFDAEGNWTKRRELMSTPDTGAFEPTHITYRTITYY